MSALKILVFAHDLSDPAVARRVTMLRSGGAVVTVAGFRRTAELVASVAGCSTVNFGQTYNAKFVQRVWSVIREILCLGKRRALFADADVIIARNLEMMAIAVRGQSMCAPAPIIVYECLDIHRLLLNRGPIGAMLRTLEGWLAKRASALITSSPAFVENYFNTLSNVQLPIRLVENKVLGISPAAKAPRQACAPWVIGWFGVIRCRKSLQILTELVRQSAGAVEVIIRGRPALDQFDDFLKTVSETPGIRFLGAYNYPDDLEEMYRGVHFNWAIDMFEEGLNSSWLLPNRLYEGGAFGAVPVAMESVETGRFLKKLGIGVMLDHSLGDFFRGLTPEKYRAYEAAVLNVPQTTWVYGKEDCDALVAYLREVWHG